PAAAPARYAAAAECSIPRRWEEASSRSLENPVPADRWPERAGVVVGIPWWDRRGTGAEPGLLLFAVPTAPAEDCPGRHFSDKFEPTPAGSRGRGVIPRSIPVGPLRQISRRLASD